MTFHHGVTGGLSLGDVTSYLFLPSGLRSQKAGGVNKHEPGYLEPRVESAQASGDLVCPRAGVGPGVSFRMSSVLLPLLEASCLIKPQTLLESCQLSLLRSLKLSFVGLQ